MDDEKLAKFDQDLAKIQELVDKDIPTVGLQRFFFHEIYGKDTKMSQFIRALRNRDLDVLTKEMDAWIRKRESDLKEILQQHQRREEEREEKREEQTSETKHSLVGKIRGVYSSRVANSAKRRVPYNPGTESRLDCTFVHVSGFINYLYCLCKQ